MAAEHRFLALDLGAESGRGELVTLAGGKVTMEEIHRFPNRPVRLAGTRYWDFPSLFAEIIATLKICARRGEKLSGISVDTWGVDFGLLDRDGRLLSNPVQYRDSRTEGIHAYSDPIMSRDEIFAATAYEPWAIASLFQLLAMQRDRSPLLEMAQTFLNMPDLVLYFLTGAKASEMSILNTSCLMGTDCRWAGEVLHRFRLNERMFCRIVPPGTVLGTLSPEVAAEVGGLGEVPVIATCGHDTSAAVAAIPGEGSDWAFLSCGTWSILGCLMDTPVATPRCLQLGFTNEYTFGGWYLARNISGLWLVQQLKAKWDHSADPWDYNRMTAAASQAAGGTLVDVADETFHAPLDMEKALRDSIARSGQAAPSDRGQLVRCVLESLALEYACRMDSVAELTGRRMGRLYMVGGGTANKLLCQLTADACGVSVFAGADQCTALGNALVQAVAVGALKDRSEIQQVMRDSFKLTEYRPRDKALWADKRAAYEKIRGRK
ncbi:MAG: FGGY-family carbohydrate kinase [Phycisphaerae bacterium]|jgi:sugar (pentulose or hexulose) kinase